MLKHVIALLGAASLAGCNFGGEHVAFGKRIQHSRPPSQNVVDVYFDRVGDLYPDWSVKIVDRDMKKALTLKEYFSHGGNPTCARYNHTQASRELCAAGALDEPARSTRWDALQDRQFDALAKALGAKLRETRGPLVVLVHGFRVDDADYVYSDIQRRMNDYLGEDARPVYLQVHWDGLHSPTPIGVWGEAQVNGYLVGLALRRVLAEVAPETPLRVMTHSSGAFVLSATLGDPAAVFQKHVSDSAEFARFHANAAGTARYPLPRSKDLRAALIVPATPPWSYAGGIDEDRQQHPGMLAPARLIVGLNAKDVGVSKGPVGGNWSLFGSTALGQDARAFCQLKASFAARAPGQAAPAPALVDFQGSPPVVRAWRWESHDWEDYLQRQKMRTVFGLLFDADPGGAGDPVSC
ncbi:hypothetical protein [Massilia sp. SYSU DXS3249]